MNKFIPLVIFAILVGFLYVGLDLDPKKLPSPLIGKSFPNLEVEDFRTGEKYLIKDLFKDKVSLVNVWASWCITCRAEHQQLNYIARQNLVQMIGVNYKDTRREADNFLRNLGDPFDFIIFDKLGRLGLELGVYATPETFLVNSQGVIIFKHIGEINPIIWNKKILPLLDQAQ